MESSNDEISKSKSQHGFLQQLQQQQLQQLEQQVQRLQNQQHSSPHPEGQPKQATTSHAERLTNKRKLYAIDEREESSPVTVGGGEVVASEGESLGVGVTVPDVAYDADVDDTVEAVNVVERAGFCSFKSAVKIQNEREQIYELFQPWALKTYGDQAKTKTITLRKKARILKALEGKEHSRPDSSKFRFWVKTKGFTTKRPECFEEAPGSQRRLEPLPPGAVLSDHASAVDLYAASTSKDFGKHVYRKVACVEEFFDIIYNVHMELGGRSGMHAGQKRTYRIITETYAFLPREAVTRFLTICPECKKNLRPSSPSVSAYKEEIANESSSEVEALNYSSHTESSLEAGPTAKKRRHSNAECGHSLKSNPIIATAVELAMPRATSASSLARHSASPVTLPVDETVAKSSASVPKIRVKLQLQRPLTPTPSTPTVLATPTPTPTSVTTAPSTPVTTTPSHIKFPPIQIQVPEPRGPAPNPSCFDMQLLKSRDSFLRYYEFMRRFYAGGSLDFMLTQPVLAPPLYGSSLLQSLSYPTSAAAATTTTTAGTILNQPKIQPKVTSPTQTDSILSNRPSQSTIAEEAPQPKKFKCSPDSLKHAKVAHSSSTVTPTQLAMNLSKELFSRSNGTPPPPTPATQQPSTSTCVAPQTPKPTQSQPQTSPLTSTPIATIKTELTSPPKPLSELRIPHVRPLAPPQVLPPLDLERLKPITSTYLQLTRSMGLSDEDALRFDNLLSY